MLAVIRKINLVPPLDYALPDLWMRRRSRAWQYKGSMPRIFSTWLLKFPSSLKSRNLKWGRGKQSFAVVEAREHSGGGGLENE